MLEYSLRMHVFLDCFILKLFLQRRPEKMPTSDDLTFPFQHVVHRYSKNNDLSLDLKQILVNVKKRKENANQHINGDKILCKFIKKTA